MFERMIEKGKEMDGNDEKVIDFLQVLLQLVKNGGDAKTPLTIAHVKALFVVIIYMSF